MWADHTRVQRSAAEWNVRASTPSTPSASSRRFSSLAALSVKVTARIRDGSNAPLRTWQAIRCVIVVVLPVPAPARMRPARGAQCGRTLGLVEAGEDALELLRHGTPVSCSTAGDRVGMLGDAKGPAEGRAFRGCDVAQMGRTFEACGPFWP